MSTSFTYATASLSPADQTKVPAGQYLPLLASEVLTAVESGARVYAYLEPGTGAQWGEIVSLRSQYDLERFDRRVSFAWASGVTVADLIGRA